MRITLGPKGHYAHSDSAEIEDRELLLSMFHGLVPANKAVRVGAITPDLCARINAQTQIVRVTPVSIMKVKGKHAEILYQDLELLQHGFNNGRIQQDGPRHFIFLFRDPRLPTRTLKAVVKATHRGAELILSSYHICTGKRLTAALKRGTLVRDW